MTLEFINKYVDDIILISEEEIKEGMKTLIKETHNLAEGAGAASTTAIIKIKDKIKNKKVVSILSGCNINSDILKGLF
jgi:threonine dehydratase